MSHSFFKRIRKFGNSYINAKLPEKGDSFDYAVLEELWVNPEFRNKHIASLLLKFLERKCKRRGIDTIEVEVISPLSPNNQQSGLSVEESNNDKQSMPKEQTLLEIYKSLGFQLSYNSEHDCYSGRRRVRK